MRVSQAEMDKSHQKIVEGASRLMREHGIETTSVNDVMSKAGMTHGGFYRHFDSKEALVRAALESAFDEVVRMMEEAYRTLGVKKGAKEYVGYYLSEGHLKHPELGCPVAALGVDVTRASPAIKETFSQGFNRAIDMLSQAGDGSEHENKAAAIRKLSMLAGALMIARATNATTSKEVMSACMGT